MAAEEGTKQAEIVSAFPMDDARFALAPARNGLQDQARAVRCPSTRI